MKSYPPYLWLATVGAGALFFALGCSSSSGQSTADGGSGGDTGTTGDTGGGGGGGSTENAVVISQGDDPAVGFISLLTASIHAHYSSASVCTATTSGPCVLSSCKSDAGTLTDESAGTITVTGGKLAGPESIKIGSNGQYTVFSEMKQIFAAGDTFKVTAAGGAFPAFSGESAPAPAVLTLTGPASTAGTAGPVYGFDPTKALTWTWTGGSAGDSVIFNTANLTTNVLIACTFDAAGGTGPIPADVVAKLPHGTSAVPADMFYFAQSSTTVSAGSQSVSINVTSSGQPIFILAN